VEKGIESLLLFSMAESRTADVDKQEFISLPLVANVFGRKKLNVSPQKSSIEGDVEILQMLGPTRRSDIHLGLAKRVENFIVNISRRIDKGESFAEYSPVLEMICRAYYPGWLLLARWYIETGWKDNIEKAKDALHRFLENDASSPEGGKAWLMLGHACYLTGDALGEVRALIERAQLTSVSFSDISRAAGLLNGLLKEQYSKIQKEDKRELAQRVVSVMEKRRSEADANDYSTMAWLAIHLDQEAVARDYVTTGLSIDRDNYHCLRLAQRFEMAV
jgi:hypothetical protein